MITYCLVIKVPPAHDLGQGPVTLFRKISEFFVTMVTPAAILYVSTTKQAQFHIWTAQGPVHPWKQIGTLPIDFLLHVNHEDGHFLT